jgi:predicted metalloprotease with PDZ domain
LAAASACRTTAGVREEPSEIEYALEWLEGDEPRVLATLRATGEADGTTEFGLITGWGGVPDGGEWIREVRAESREGRELALEPLGNARFVAAHEPGERVTLRWELAPLADEGYDRSNEYRPLVRKALVHVIGNTGLLTPLALRDADVPSTIEFDWRGFEREGWSCASSHGLGARVAVRCPLSEFLQAVFLAGDVELERREVPGGELIVAAPRDSEAVELSALADATAAIVRAERTFFADTTQPYYFVSALPMGAPEAHGFSLGGTGLTDSFALFYQRGASLADDSPTREPLLSVLAHEHFHNWCGLAIAPEGTEQLAYWFTEGFTSFYTGRMLRAARLATEEQRRREVDEALARYWKSPARGETNAVIAERFWTDRDVGELPYQRGFVVALALDAEMRRASGGTRTLDDGMRELLAEARATGERFTTEELLARFERWTSAEVARSLAELIERGGVLEPDPMSWGVFGDLCTCPAYALDPGFDVETTMEQRIVFGVRQGSAAWKAGLRDGQKLAGLSYAGSANIPVSMTVVDRGQRRALEFLPCGPLLAVPYFEPRPDSQEP